MSADIQHADAVALVDVLSKHIVAGGAPVNGYAEAGRMIGRNDSDARHMGQVTSRIDLASFYAGLPMLALNWVRTPDGNINPESFATDVWSSRRDLVVTFAKTHQWTPDELAAVRRKLIELREDSARLQWEQVTTRECAKPGYIDYNLHRRCLAKAP